MFDIDEPGPGYRPFLIDELGPSLRRLPDRFVPGRTSIPAYANCGLVAPWVRFGQSCERTNVWLAQHKRSSRPLPKNIAREVRGPA